MQVDTVSWVGMSQSLWLENVCYIYMIVLHPIQYTLMTCHRTSSPYISSGCVFPVCPAGIIFGNLCCRCHWKLFSMQTTIRKWHILGCLCMYTVFLAEIYTLTIIVRWTSACAYIVTCSQVTACMTVDKLYSLPVHCMIKSCACAKMQYTLCVYIYVCVVVYMCMQVWVWEQMRHSARMWPLFCWRTTSAHQTSPSDDCKDYVISL